MARPASEEQHFVEMLNYISDKSETPLNVKTSIENCSAKDDGSFIENNVLEDDDSSIISNASYCSYSSDSSFISYFIQLENESSFSELDDTEGKSCSFHLKPRIIF